MHGPTRDDASGRLRSIWYVIVRVGGGQSCFGAYESRIGREIFDSGEERTPDVLVVDVAE